MSTENNLQRFIDAQARNYNDALAEIKNGRKTTHWMWYVFPQIQGLGLSETAKFYAIEDAQEAEAFVQHPVLGGQLVEISRALLALPGHDPYTVLGSPDDMKLQSSMTLFGALPNADPVFQAVLDKFYSGEKDRKTLQLLGK
ncbi:DUF1810 domain-containing protein [Hymenobacter sp. BT186]|uniref:DUF1810 domain-containing protein n=1 Tax=Hymenobacter telluris TaxID=2816474 RepID=A0A939EZT6_9BACT|nr:DUF1810 domain-containing protein [Hymenobacter telluris]MBO0360141.1 DUF1810 domain-containing protein [Hymenobacter telluris]MBW3376168.1 DUF1810 domain-containing protein [Hymenobacter norwichensis]